MSQMAGLVALTLLATVSARSESSSMGPSIPASVELPAQRIMRKEGRPATEDPSNLMPVTLSETDLSQAKTSVEVPPVVEVKISSTKEDQKKIPEGSVCTGAFYETNSVGVAERPPANTPCVGTCMKAHGRYGPDFCFTEKLNATNSLTRQWGAPCTTCRPASVEDTLAETTCRVGDSVRAQWLGDFSFYPAKIQALHGNGSAQLDWKDADQRFRIVNLTNIFKGELTCDGCPNMWTKIGGKCFSPQRSTGFYVPDDNCARGTCAIPYKVCQDDGAEIATKEEMHLWLKAGNTAPAGKRYAITSTYNQKYGDYHWLVGGGKDTTDYGWHENGCCAQGGQRYFVCTKPAACSAKAVDKCAGRAPCIDLRQGLKTSNVMYMAGFDRAVVREEKKSWAEGQCACSNPGNCSGIFGNWSCPADFFGGNFSIANDFSDDSPVSAKATSAFFDVCQASPKVTDLYAVGIDKKLYHQEFGKTDGRDGEKLVMTMTTKTPWKHVGAGNISSICVVRSHDYIYAVGPGHFVYRQTLSSMTNTSAWIKISKGSVRNVAIKDDMIYAIGTDWKIYKQNHHKMTPFSSWVLVAECCVMDIAFHGDMIYGVHKGDQLIWVQTLSTMTVHTKWIKIDTVQYQSISVVADSIIGVDLKGVVQMQKLKSLGLYGRRRTTTVVSTSPEFLSVSADSQLKIYRTKSPFATIADDDAVPKFDYISLGAEHCKSFTGYQGYCDGTDACAANPKAKTDVSGASLEACKEKCDSKGAACVAVAFKDKAQCVLYQGDCTSSGDGENFGFEYYRKEVGNIYTSLKKDHCISYAAFQRWCHPTNRVCGDPRQIQTVDEASHSEFACKLKCEALGDHCVAMAFKANDQCITYQGKCVDSGDGDNFGFQYYRKDAAVLKIKANYNKTGEKLLYAEMVCPWFFGVTTGLNDVMQCYDGNTFCHSKIKNKLWVGRPVLTEIDALGFLGDPDDPDVVVTSSGSDTSSDTPVKSSDGKKNISKSVSSSDWIKTEACCAKFGGVFECPSNYPFMCRNRACGGDHCCVPNATVCTEMGGLRGCEGPTGIKGLVGLKGHSGIKGFRGRKGSMGKAGFIGPHGEKGEDGNVVAGAKGLTLGMLLAGVAFNSLLALVMLKVFKDDVSGKLHPP